MPPTRTPATPLKRPAFYCLMAPAGHDPADDLDDEQLTTVHVVVHSTDQLRAELEANKLRLDPRKHAMHLTALWLWCAMVRQGDYGGDWRAFRTDMLAYEPDRARSAPHVPEPGDDLDDYDPPADDLDALPTEASTS